MSTYQFISDRTAFDAGERFASPHEVRQYFTVQNMIDMFGREEAARFEELTDQSELDWMAEEVIQNKWHCNW